MKNDEMEDDEVMQEVREIRARIREETKNMTHEEVLARRRAAAERTQQRIDEIRAQKRAAKMETVPPNP